MRIPRQAAKCISLASSMTGLGCEFSNGPARVEAAAFRVHELAFATVGLLGRGVASPRSVNASCCLPAQGWQFSIGRMVLYVKTGPTRCAAFLQKYYQNLLLELDCYPCLGSNSTSLMLQ